jgi:hypothetical protein
MLDVPVLVPAGFACKRIIRPKRLGYRDHFHRVGGRIERPPSHAEYALLRRHSSSCYWHELEGRGWYHPNPEAAYMRPRYR